MTRSIVFICLVICLLMTTACAPRRPVLYPNDHYREVGPEVARRDVDECIAQAEAFGAGAGRDREVAGEAAMEAGAGAAVGAAVGAVAGGEAGTGAAIGAVGAGVHRLARGVLSRREPGPVLRAFVERCLREKGYETIGWK